MKSGSILLFHNDLENTTKALPSILTQLRDKGYEFVIVSDLIYHDDYTINSNGMQIQQVKAGIDINSDNVDEVMAQYKEEISAAGFTDEQLAMAADAIKNGTEIPDDVMAVIADLGIDIPTAATAGGAVDTGSSSQLEQKGSGNSAASNANNSTGSGSTSVNSGADK